MPNDVYASLMAMLPRFTATPGHLPPSAVSKCTGPLTGRWNSSHNRLHSGTPLLTVKLLIPLSLIHFSINPGGVDWRVAADSWPQS